MSAESSKSPLMKNHSPKPLTKVAPLLKVRRQRPFPGKRALWRKNKGHHRIPRRILYQSSFMVFSPQSNRRPLFRTSSGATTTILITKPFFLCCSPSPKSARGRQNFSSKTPKCQSTTLLHLKFRNSSVSFKIQVA